MEEAEYQPLRWVCENCGHVNVTTLAYYRERAEAVGEDYVWYGDTCEVCARGVGDVREQPRAD